MNAGAARRLAAGSWSLTGLIVLVVAVSLVGSLGSEVLDRVVVTMLINLILVVALYIFIGLTGVFSFGHVAFMAIGAYTAAILTIPPELKFVVLADLPAPLSDMSASAPVATLAGAGVAALFALVAGAPLMRLSGLSAALGTLSLLIIVNVVAANWQAITHGTAGISGVPTTTGLPTALAWASGTLVVAFAYQRSRFGLRARATREDDVAARATGISVARQRTGALVLSAFVAGAGGALYAQYVGSFTPNVFYLTLTFSTIAMLVIGGARSLAGAVYGTIVITALTELLRRAEQGFSLGLVEVSAKTGLREIGLALVMLAMLILRPGGLTAGRELEWPPFSRLRRIRGRRRTSPDLVGQLEPAVPSKEGGSS